MVRIPYYQNDPSEWTVSDHISHLQHDLDDFRGNWVSESNPEKNNQHCLVRGFDYEINKPDQADRLQQSPSIASGIGSLNLWRQCWKVRHDIVWRFRRILTMSIQAKDAEQLDMQVMEIKKKVLGMEHPQASLTGIFMEHWKWRSTTPFLLNKSEVFVLYQSKASIFVSISSWRVADNGRWTPRFSRRRISITRCWHSASRFAARWGHGIAFLAASV